MFEDDAVAPRSSWGSGFSILSHQSWSFHRGTPASAIVTLLGGGGAKTVTRMEAKSGGEEGKAYSRPHSRRHEPLPTGQACRSAPS